MKTFERIKRLPEFDRDLRRLLKKFRTLEDDIEIFIRAQLFLYHKMGIDNEGIVQIQGLGITSPEIYKVTKYACRSLKGTGVKSGIRIVYACSEIEDTVEFIEIYYKGEKETENRERILKHYDRRDNK